MNDIDKINIYVDSVTKKIIETDCQRFEVFKKDGNNNTNRFLTMLITEYYDAFEKECASKADAISEVLSKAGLTPDEVYEVKDSIMKNVIMPSVPRVKGKKRTQLSLKPTKESFGTITTIEDKIGKDDFISQYLCRMLISYSNKSIPQRERIIFKKNYDELLYACQSKHEITFSLIGSPKTIYQIIPYSVCVGTDEMFNYVIGQESYKDQLRTIVFRLNRITNIHYSNSGRVIDQNVENNLKLMEKYGPQFAINNSDEICVRLAPNNTNSISQSGQTLFKRIYFGRPIVERIEPDIENHGSDLYYFHCSEEQIFQYFKRFDGGTAEILYPQRLRDRMILFHKKNYESYL